MRYNLLGPTGLKVSQICLGTMTWGEQNSEADAHAQLDYAVAAGVNFIDTAEMYPVPPRAETYTRTETYIGNWLARRKDRDQLVLASKIAGPAGRLPYIRKGPKLVRQQVVEALDASLRRLQTDYLDLYQVHWPARNTNFFGKLGYVHDEAEQVTPILETLQALGEQVQAGKIRHIGVSNETPWGVMTWLMEAERHGLPRIVSIQNPYNLLNRSFEVGLAEAAHRESVPLLAYSPLAFGVLSGKYRGGAEPVGARLTLFKYFDRYHKPGAAEATEAYAGIAEAQGLSLTQLALAYVNTRSFCAANIIGATSLEQLRENIGSIDVELSDETLQAIEAVHQLHSNPCP